MTSVFETEYSPSVATLPGEILQEALDERGMTQAQLAERMGRPKKTINEIIKGKAAITSETALQLEMVLGVQASFWTNLEALYRESLARSDERTRLEHEVWWLKEIPLSHMLKEGWIGRFDDKVEQLKEALRFFQIASPDQWDQVVKHPQAAFRKSSAFEINAGSVAAWLQKGKFEAEKVDCRSFNAELVRAMVGEARSLTLEPDPKVFLPKLKSLCAEVGIALVLLREVKGSRVCGVARWLAKDKALIQLSARHLRGDSLWFTFFHEVGHILLHPRSEIFLETGKHEGERELEANRFAEESLIPPNEFTRLISSPFTRQSVIAFAKSSGIAPGIVVGRLQNEHLIPWGSQWESLKFRYQWEETGAH